MKFRCKPSKLDDAKHIYAKNQSINNMAEAYIYEPYMLPTYVYTVNRQKPMYA